MDTALGILACLMPLVLAAIMIQTRRDAERAMAQLNERVHMLSRRCDVMQDTLDRYHAAAMDAATSSPGSRPTRERRAMTPREAECDHPRDPVDWRARAHAAEGLLASIGAEAGAAADLCAQALRIDTPAALADATLRSATSLDRIVLLADGEAP